MWNIKFQGCHIKTVYFQFDGDSKQDIGARHVKFDALHIVYEILFACQQLQSDCAEHWSYALKI